MYVKPIGTVSVTSSPDGPAVPVIAVYVVGAKHVNGHIVGRLVTTVIVVLNVSFTRLVSFDKAETYINV